MIDLDSMTHFTFDCAPGPDGSALLTIQVPKECASLVPGMALMAAAQTSDPAHVKLIQRLANKLAAAFDGKRSDADGNPVGAPS